MNVSEEWVKSVCEKLGIHEPVAEYGCFWDGELEFPYGGSIAERIEPDDDYEFREMDGTGWEHFKPFSPETIASIKKDLGIE
jgi:hypothetical protein